jgi:hypothetical protein
MSSKGAVTVNTERKRGKLKFETAEKWAIAWHRDYEKLLDRAERGTAEFTDLQVFAVMLKERAAGRHPNLERKAESIRKDVEHQIRTNMYFRRHWEECTRMK